VYLYGSFLVSMKFLFIKKKKNIFLPYLVSYSMYVLGIQNNVAGGKGLI
jgi:hypothetical protein